MKHPIPGEVMYGDEHQNGAVKIVRVEGTIVWHVPVGTEVRSTHQGNLYDANGERGYRV